MADLHRRCELSRKSNEAYLEAMAVVECPETLETLAKPASASLEKDGRRYRGLNLLSAHDRLLLQAICRGEFVIAGFRNKDLRSILFGPASADHAATKKQSGQVTRRLQLLRAHGLIHKVPKSHRYKITALGSNLAAAVSYASDSSLKHLSAAG